MWKARVALIQMKLKKLPWQQITGVLCLLLVAACFWLDREQDALADKVLRLHVLANSDTEEDQALKLCVREGVLAAVGPWIAEEGDAAEAAALLEVRLPELQMEAQRLVWEEGYNYPVTVKMEEHYFPSRSYDGFALPAGSYQSLRVVIGEGAGQNWWCVVFPPLCNAASTEAVAESAGEAGLTEQEVFLILEEREEYVIKFRAIELWEQVKHLLEQ